MRRPASERRELCTEHEGSHFKQFLKVQLVIKKFMTYFSVYFINQLTAFWRFFII
jgi:hypothetical protein